MVVLILSQLAEFFEQQSGDLGKKESKMMQDTTRMVDPLMDSVFQMMKKLKGSSMSSRIKHAFYDKEIGDIEVRLEHIKSSLLLMMYVRANWAM